MHAGIAIEVALRTREGSCKNDRNECTPRGRLKKDEGGSSAGGRHGKENERARTAQKMDQAVAPREDGERARWVSSKRSLDEVDAEGLGDAVDHAFVEPELLGETRTAAGKRKRCGCGIERLGGRRGIERRGSLGECARVNYRLAVKERRRCRRRSHARLLERGRGEVDEVKWRGRRGVERVEDACDTEGRASRRDVDLGAEVPLVVEEGEL